MYPVAIGSYLVQQRVTGTGVYSALEFGRAKVTLPNGDPNAVVYVAAKAYGLGANALTISLVDLGAGITYPTTTVTQVGGVVTVTLQRDSIGGLQARAVDVADAINAFLAFGTPLRARFGGTGLGIVAALAPLAFTGGLDPVLGPAYAGALTNVFKWTRDNLDAGFFFFEQETDLILRQLEFNFTGVGASLSLTVSRVNLDAGLEPIATEKVPFFEGTITPSAPDLAVSDVRVLLHPFQAVLVECAAAGVARVDVARAGAFFLP